jgi:hypothetical protein
MLIGIAKQKASTQLHRIVQSLLAHPGTGSWQTPKSSDLGGTK